MNIFKRRDSFFGCSDSGLAEDSLLSLFRLAKQIRLRLGRQGYLLDNYLSLIFEGMHNEHAHDAAGEGFSLGGEFQGILFHVMDGIEPKNHHPLYQHAQKIFEQRADIAVYQERYTKLSLILFLMADKLLADSSVRYMEEQESRLGETVDIVCIRELYEQISHLSGEFMMEELNEKIRQRFLIAPPAIAFAQGLTDELLYKLTARDSETSKQMFQLLLDSLPETEAP